MVNYIKIEDNKIVGIDVITLKEAKEQSKKESFDLLFQSNLTLDTYGILKEFYSKGKSGYGFVPIFIKQKLVTE